MSMKIFHIGIAGAGISGLMAGLEILSAGHAVTIFEARNRTGGRIQSLDLDGMVVETGPEFIHGNLNETIGLLKKYKIRYDPVDGKNYIAKKGQLKESFDMVEGWDLLLEKMKSLDKDLPLGEFLEKNFPGNRFLALRQTAAGFAEGFDLADVQTASTRSLYTEWQHGEAEQYRIRDGYGKLIHSMENEFLKMGGKILTDHPVERVERNRQEIKINISGGRAFNLDKLIITLPLSAFNQKISGPESIFFFPPLGEKQDAFRQIGFGTVVKIVMIWESSFWEQAVPEAQFIFSDHFIPTWWTQCPMDLPMLTGWLGGSKAARFADQGDEFFLEKAIESLAGIFTRSAETIKKELKHVRIFNWKNEPWSRGAYSYALAGYNNAKSVCRKSIESRMYFAGEAYYEGPYPGTVEAAVVNGRETARQLLREIKKK
jgi:monoamine oxidase